MFCFKHSSVANLYYQYESFWNVATNTSPKGQFLCCHGSTMVIIHPCYHTSTLILPSSFISTSSLYRVEAHGVISLADANFVLVLREGWKSTTEGLCVLQMRSMSNYEM